MNAQARALGQVPIEDDADSVASLDAQCTSMLERASKLHPCKVCSGLREKAMGHNYAFLESRAHEKIRTSVQESTVVLESRAHLFTKAQYFHGRHSLVSTDAKQIRFGLHRLVCTAWSTHTHTHTKVCTAWSQIQELAQFCTAWFRVERLRSKSVSSPPLRLDRRASADVQVQLLLNRSPPVPNHFPPSATTWDSGLLRRWRRAC